MRLTSDEIHAALATRPLYSMEDRTMYQFEVIADSRWGETKNDLIRWTKSIRNALAEMDGIELSSLFYSLKGNIKHLGWKDGTVQWRTRLCISKNTRQITWNSVFGTINNIRVCAYSRYRP